ncbi:hypothetical protein PWG71_10040 [Nocardiopsis sp. N85]|nr:hypothetical protein [Nocardiopsis sp. N85]MDE3721728.1 hypothetical protein [Nocardiopsis sp. N85]
MNDEHRGSAPVQEKVADDPERAERASPTPGRPLPAEPLTRTEKRSACSR